MATGTVRGICLAPSAGAPMEARQQVMLLEGLGLVGDRYSSGEGSWNKGAPGKRQVTLINAHFVRMSHFTHAQTRRNFLIEGTEIMDLIGKEFDLGEARLRGVKYCDPCLRPSHLAKTPYRFNEEFHDCAGIIADILSGGLVNVGDALVPPSKNRS